MKFVDCSKRAAVAALLLLTATGVYAQDAGDRAARFAQLPDWTGIWVTAGAGGDIDVDGYGKRSGLAEWTILGFAAPYTPEVRARFERELPEIMAESARLKAQGWGFPIMMETATPLQFLLTPEETLILNFYREARHVYTDGRALPPAADRWPVPWGESVGHWEGDTLVIETESVQQPGIFNIHLPLLSDEARYVERIRKTGPDRIESDMTIHDPATLTQPWQLHFTYERAAGFDRMFHMEFENDRTLIGEDGLSLTPEALTQ